MGRFEIAARPRGFLRAGKQRRLAETEILKHTLRHGAAGGFADTAQRGLLVRICFARHDHHGVARGTDMLIDARHAIGHQDVAGQLGIDEMPSVRLAEIIMSLVNQNFMRQT